jgi:hypothetical protein
MMMLQREMEERRERMRLMERERRERDQMEMMRMNRLMRPGLMYPISPDGGMFGVDLAWVMDGVGMGEDLSAAPKSEPDRKALPRFGVALADDGETDVQLAKEAESLLGYNVLRRKLKIPGKLGEVLACLEIEPLDTTAVEKYKLDMVLWRKKEVFEKAAADPSFNRHYTIDVSWRRVLLGDCQSEVPLFALRKAVQVKKGCPEAMIEVDELIEQKKLIDPFLVATLDDETYYLEVWKEPKFEEKL